MSEVISKYKNPDRLIKRLRNEAEGAWKSAKANYNMFEQVNGRHIGDYDNVVEATDHLNVYGTALDDVNPGDKISITVIINKVVKYIDSDGKRCSKVAWDCSDQEVRVRGGSQ